MGQTSMTDAQAAAFLRELRLQLSYHAPATWQQAVDMAIDRLDHPRDKALSDILAGLEELGRMARERQEFAKGN